jgi:hypothetical protein
MRHRFVVLALLAALVPVAAGCGGTSSQDGDAAAPATTAATAAPTTAPPTTGKAPAEAARPAPAGVVPAGWRQPAPDLRVTALDGRTVTMAGFRGQPVVVNFFESW